MKKNHYFSKPVIAASGVLGFFGEGYFHYKIFNILSLGLFRYILKNFVTFQSKTTTALQNDGNAELNKNGYSLKRIFPNCVAKNFWKGWMVNIFGLSGLGLEFLLDQGFWYEIKGELHLSIYLDGKTSEERIEKAKYIVILLQKNLHKFKASKIFLNWNKSCPNTGHKEKIDFFNSFMPEYQILSELKLPILVKVDWQFPIDIALKIQELPLIYGFVAINSIPFDELPDSAKKKYFKKDGNGNYVSPLAKYQDSFKVKGNGGVSGHPIREFSIDWIIRAINGGISKPIIGSGGIMNFLNVFSFWRAGATAFSIGTCVSLRFWNLPLIILTGKILFRKH